MRFHFQRTLEPTEPSWAHADRAWSLGVPSGLPDLTPMWLASWRWLLGSQSSALAEEKAMDVAAVGTPQPAPALAAVHRHLSGDGADGLSRSMVEQLTWCDWQRVQDEVWACHVNWECCGHWRASPFDASQRKFDEPPPSPTGGDDPRRSLRRQVPALRLAYSLAATGHTMTLCEALLREDSTAVPVAQALAAAPRSAAPERFVAVFRRLTEVLEEGSGSDRVREDCAFVVGELALSLNAAAADDAELLCRAVGALASCGADPVALVRRAAGVALQHCATALLRVDKLLVDKQLLMDHHAEAGVGVRPPIVLFCFHP